MSGRVDAGGLGAWTGMSQRAPREPQVAGEVANLQGPLRFVSSARPWVAVPRNQVPPGRHRRCVVAHRPAPSILQAAKRLRPPCPEASPRSLQPRRARRRATEAGGSRSRPAAGALPRR